jgi:ligand-binding sensor domain-containing protein
LTKYSYKFLFVFLISISVFAQPTILKNIRPLSPSEQYVVTSWNSNSGLPQNSINRIVEDKNGFIWLAT